MNIFELMDLRASSFSKTDRRIYEAVKKFPDSFATKSITEISETSGFSKPALSRFAKKLDFGGFTEFQYQFAQQLKNRQEETEKTGNAEIYGRLLKQVEQSVPGKTIDDLIARMRMSRSVSIYGSNLSRLPAEMLYMSLQFETDFISVLPPVDMNHYHHHPDDLYIIYSAISGDSHQTLMKELRKLGSQKPYLVLVTANSKHPLRHNFDEVIVLPSVSLASGNRIVYSDTFAFMMFNEMIYEHLHQQ